MKTTSYKTYKCNGFTLKYYSKSYIQDGVYYGEYVVAYYNGRRIVDRSTSEKRGLYDIICRLSDEERRLTTDAYINENAARMGVAPCIVKAHIEEVQKKNSRAAVPAPKMEITAADIALYDYALGGAPVDGYTIGCADAVLKLMKKEGITPAAVDRARKKMKKQQPAPAAPVADEQPAAAPSIKNADTPSTQKKQLAAWNGAVVEIIEICAADNTAVVKIKGGSHTRIPADALEPTTAKKTTLPDWMMPGTVIDVKNAVRNDAPPTRHTIESVKATNIYYTDGTYSSINYIMHYGSPVDDAPAAPVVDAPAADTPALTDADVLAAAARIKSNYEAMKQQAAADAYADAITAYCEAMEEPAAPAWAPEVITVTPCPAWDDTPAADEQPAPAPRARRRLNITPRLSRWLHPARWVAVAFVVCLMSGLLLGMNTSTAAADAAAVTDAPATPSPVKKLAAPSPVKNAAADAVTPAGQKTASDIATATAPAADDADSLTTAPAANGLQPTPPDGLTICAGTAWAYTMMNWA